MKSRIKKIIISAAALIFVTSGVSLAHASDKRNHKRQGKAYGHHEVKKHHPSSSNKKFKPGKHHVGMSKKHYELWKRHRNQYRKQYLSHHVAGYYCEDGFYHNYAKAGRRWKRDHWKQRRHQNESHGYKKGNYDDNYYRRHAPREDVVYKVALKDPKIVFKVIRKDH